MSGMNMTNKKRLMALLLFAAFAFFACICKVFDLSVIRAGEYQDKAENQWTQEIGVSAQRGGIYDTNGNLLAQSATVESVLLLPKTIDKSSKSTNPDNRHTAEEIASLLAPILDMSYDDVLQKAKDTSKTEVWLKRQITDEQASAIRELNLPGVDFFTDTQRYYTNGAFMSQVLGYTNADGDGQEGLEKAYDKYLAGYDGVKLSLVDASGRELADGEEMYIEPDNGLNLNLTLDMNIQSFAETAAKEAYEVNKAKKVVAIVMDPNDGSVLGMVNYPEADLNNLDRSNSVELAAISKNTAIVDAYEPGSTFKIITTAAALDSGAATVDSTFNCSGYKTVDGQKIKCWRSGNPHGTQTLMEGVANSCNPVFMELALKMGTEKFYEYIYNFGFGKTTGVDYSADAAGIVTDSKYIKNTDLARIGFGQSVAVTPLQLITAVSAVINGGNLYTPHLVKSLTDSDGNVVQETDTTAKRQVISESTSATMRQILENVVSNGGGKNAQIEGYKVGGKTGTAQVYENGAIAQGKNISSFIGFAPADDPKYIVLFIVYEPDVAVTYGSVVAAPYAKDILEKCLQYGNVQPTVSKTGEGGTAVPNFIGMTEDEAKNAANEAGFSIDWSGSGDKAVTQNPSAGSEVAQGSTIEISSSKTSEEEVPLKNSDVLDTVPKLTGMSLANAYRSCKVRGLNMIVKDDDMGNGVVVSQDLTPGSAIPVEKTITVICGDTSAAQNIVDSSADTAAAQPSSSAAVGAQNVTTPQAGSSSTPQPSSSAQASALPSSRTYYYNARQ